MPLHFFTSSIHHCPTESSGIFLHGNAAFISMEFLFKRSVCKSSSFLVTVLEQGAQSVGTGSINRSSRKRRGRGPTKLIEPRREADRPVLTPNNTEYVL